jgi:TetR/AcrR family transcriptional regulator, tetracycline repressor protein
MKTDTKAKGRPPRRAASATALTPARIADVALGEISANGRAALSMRTLAAKLGCEAMSLYHHVEGIEGVLDAVVDRMLESLLAQQPDKSSPRAALEAFARSYLSMAETHPQAFPLVATRLWRTPNALAAAGRAIAWLRELGLTPRAALRNARVLGAYLNGAGLALSAWASEGGERAQAGAANAELAPLAAARDATNVRADLFAGLRQLLDNAVPPAAQ